MQVSRTGGMGRPLRPGTGGGRRRGMRAALASGPVERRPIPAPFLAAWSPPCRPFRDRRNIVKRVAPLLLLACMSCGCSEFAQDPASLAITLLIDAGLQSLDDRSSPPESQARRSPKLSPEAAEYLRSGGYTPPPLPEDGWEDDYFPDLPSAKDAPETARSARTPILSRIPGGKWGALIKNLYSRGEC